MKSRITSFLLLAVMSVTILTACRSSESDTMALESSSNIQREANSQSQAESKPDIITLKFNDDFDYKEYVGKKVKIRGYMSTLSPVDGKFIYLMNVPYQICPFCMPNTTTIVNTIAAYAPQNKRFDFYDGAVEIIGILSDEYTEDEFGYVYPYKIIDASYTKIDTAQLSENLKMYGSLSQDGIINDMMALTERVDYNAFFASVDMNMGIEADFMVVDNSEFDAVIKRINAISKTDYADLITILEEFKAFNDIVNANIEAQEYAMNITNEMDEKYLSLMDNLYEWLNKYEI